MDIYALLDQVVELLRRRGRATYGALKLQFKLDDETLAVLKDELLYTHPDVRADGHGLAWSSDSSATPEPAFSQPAPNAEPHVSDSPQTASRSGPLQTPDAERRQLSVMFCDLVGSTPLSEQLDPEYLREVIRAYQEVCAKVINGVEGYIGQYLGDGLLVYFGYPVAHEDDAQRAVRAGLGIIEELAQLNERLQREWGVRLNARVGIHTGLVVAGEMGGGDRREALAIVGETPNIASRIQCVAEPNTVVISAASHHLIEGFFECQSMGLYTLKGISRPTEVYRVLRASGVRSRLDATSARGLTPLVGRELEVGLLLELWNQASEGMGQVILLSGEAGIGKSRLVQVLKERVANQPHGQLECRCSPYYQNSALYPVMDVLQNIWRLQISELPEAKLEKLEQALRAYRLSLEESIPLLAALLALPLPEGRYPPLMLTPQRQRQQTLETILAILLALAEQQPLLFIVEDLHWADPTTLELLGLLIAQGPTAPTLTLMTCRPTFESPWGLRTYFTPVALNRLRPPQIELMVRRMTDEKNLPPEVLRQIVEKTDGVPLFVEEMTKAILESGSVHRVQDHYELSGALPTLAIPTTLQDFLMARLDTLVTAKVVAQCAAVIGRQFSYELLEAVLPLDQTSLQRELHHLVDAELLYQRGLPPHATYIFKHSLIQDAAYQSQLKSTRQGYHRRIVQVLEDRFPEVATTQPELLAHHCTAAGMTAQAIVYLQRAGEQAVQRLANVEADHHLTTALEALVSLPETPERNRQEFELLVTRGPAWMAMKGYAAPEVGRTYSRAYELYQQLGDHPQFVPMLVGLWIFYLLRMELDKARELGEQMLSLAQSKQDAYLLMWGHYALGNVYSFLGELHTAREHCDRCIELYDPSKHRRLVFVHGDDPRVACLIFRAWCLWYQGYADQARQGIQAAVEAAREIEHPNVLGFALSAAAMIYQLRREPLEAQQQAEATIAACGDFHYFMWHGLILLGWALVQNGVSEEGIARMREGLQAYLDTGTKWVQPYYMALIAEAHGNAGRTDEGLQVLNEALDVMRATKEYAWEAELHRIKGELLLETGAQRSEPDAEACFNRAIEVARRQDARSWELRATTSLSRLWYQQGKREAARLRLAEIYGWFTEGFDTVDLQDARTLLAELVC